jgi:hypothetical protein
MINFTAVSFSPWSHSSKRLHWSRSRPLFSNLCILITSVVITVIAWDRSALLLSFYLRKIFTHLLAVYFFYDRKTFCIHLALQRDAKVVESVDSKAKMTNLCTNEGDWNTSLVLLHRRIFTKLRILVYLILGQNYAYVYDRETLKFSWWSTSELCFSLYAHCFIVFSATFPRIFSVSGRFQICPVLKLSIKQWHYAAQKDLVRLLNALCLLLVRLWFWQSLLIII